jgi:PPM family protein phosphatase
MKVTAWGATDAGRRRSRNEDAFGVIEQDGVLVVADGMGGHRGGAVASKMAVDAVLSAFHGAGGDYESAVDRLRNDRARAGSTEPMWTITSTTASDANEDTPPVFDGSAGPVARRRVSGWSRDLFGSPHGS